jgi:hypothetical protein
MKSRNCYAMVGMIFGEVSGRAEDQTQCILCKQCDIFCVVPHLCVPWAPHLCVPWAKSSG